MCAPELEFFIVKESETGGLPTPIDMAGYFDFHPGDLTDDLRREIADTAEAFGIEIEISHHEVALGQNEIDFKYDEALKTADRTITMKMCGKVVGARNGYITTYMPKPFPGINGSGMHTNQSLWSKNVTQNLFYADDEKNGYLSDLARSFIGGQLAHGRKMCAILDSWPNSFKRLVPRLRSTRVSCLGAQKPLTAYPCAKLWRKEKRCQMRNPLPRRRRKPISAICGAPSDWFGWYQEQD